MMPEKRMSRRAFAKMIGAGVLLSFAPGALAGCSSMTDALNGALMGTRRVTDHAGREVELPTAGELSRVYFTSALGHIYCFTVAPDLMAGTAFQFTPYELEYLPEGTADLPYVGSVSGGGEVNREALLLEDVQLILSVSSEGITEALRTDADKLQDQTDIPVVCIDASFENVVECYRFLGELLGREDRGAELGSYLNGIYRRVSEAVAQVPEDARVSLYYAEGPEGLQTEPEVTSHALTFAVAGAANVAAVPENAGQGMSNVSLEQVLAWDPEVIVAWSAQVRGGADEEIRSNANWAGIRAVQNGRVYTMPNVPYAWCDRPPGVQRYLGIQWVANMLYPDAYPVDMVEVVREFYAKVFWVDVTEEQARELLGNSYPPYGKA